MKFIGKGQSFGIEACFQGLISADLRQQGHGRPVNIRPGRPGRIFAKIGKFVNDVFTRRHADEAPAR